MKRIPIYQVDVFAEKLFAGNPAAVCPLESWLPDATLQAIGNENNLSETAFFVRETGGDADFHLRWFTPTVEMDLCGHATLASGYVLFEELRWKGSRVRFRTRSGVLTVAREDGALWLDLPSYPPKPCAAPPADVLAGLRAPPADVLETPAKYFAVYRSEAEIVALAPDFARLKALTGKGVVVTAPPATRSASAGHLNQKAAGSRAGADFVSRYFAPSLGVPEDPATGSAHCLLTPYWAQRLGKTQLEGLQLSPRGARFQCVLAGDRVRMSGPVIPYMKGEIAIP